MRPNQVAGEGLLHPLTLAAVCVLLLNDHFAKAQWPGLITGKVSDVAGLVFFPLALQAAWELAHAALGRTWRPSTRVVITSVLLTALVFALVKTWGPANETYRVLFGLARWPLDAALALARDTPLPAVTRVVLIADPTDLVALPATLLAIPLARKRTSAHPTNVNQRSAHHARRPLALESDVRPPVPEFARRRAVDTPRWAGAAREPGGVPRAAEDRG